MRKISGILFDSAIVVGMAMLIYYAISSNNSSDLNWLVTGFVLGAGFTVLTLRAAEELIEEKDKWKTIEN